MHGMHKGLPCAQLAFANAFRNSHCSHLQDHDQKEPCGVCPLCCQTRSRFLIMQCLGRGAEGNGEVVPRVSTCIRED